ncbi:DivIVA family protein [Ruminiclostridium papyrosolvens DSM 2782]|uniref:DivIVA family protein n=1 Tax=Ruminiclostridium papyrosolvens DSM 2782 TaxID=588581 RepID=F1TFD5_9FIRM|nr:DivIVA domain-containing protein [Ruminiclostridium papyrosolvens]EGD46859.1 DivIVA family protein [Ruminiclostridium papyrosolvens DSM 2782]WES34344.1 DivIVA domain-containing protein [Ruminiclostridium papyrosolvens DSM 2782]
MYYTPEDFKCLCIKKSLLNGYCRKQVDAILAQVGEDYIGMAKETQEMKNKIDILNETVQHYKILEESLQHSIIVAQHTSEQIKTNACEKAKNITDEAEVSATKIIETANLEVIKARGKLDEIKGQLYSFKTKSEALISAQLDVLKQLFSEENNG